MNEFLKRSLLYLVPLAIGYMVVGSGVLEPIDWDGYSFWIVLFSPLAGVLAEYYRDRHFVNAIGRTIWVVFLGAWLTIFSVGLKSWYLNFLVSGILVVAAINLAAFFERRAARKK